MTFEKLDQNDKEAWHGQQQDRYEDKYKNKGSDKNMLRTPLTFEIFDESGEETLLDQPKDNLYRDNTQICEHISDIWDLDSEQSLSVSDSGPIPNTTPSPFLNKIQKHV